MTSTGEAVPLWERVAPGSETWNQEERAWAIPSPLDLSTLWNVVQPTLTPVLPDPAVATGTGVVVVPGGAYIMLAIDHEGFDVAEWLADRGVAAFVLKYRVMETPDSDEDRMHALVGAGRGGGPVGGPPPDGRVRAHPARRWDGRHPPVREPPRRGGSPRAHRRRGLLGGRPSGPRPRRTTSARWTGVRRCHLRPRPGRPVPETPPRCSSPWPPMTRSTTGRSRPRPRGDRPVGRSSPTSTLVEGTASACADRACPPTSGATSFAPGWHRRASQADVVTHR